MERLLECTDGEAVVREYQDFRNLGPPPDVGRGHTGGFTLRRNPGHRPGPAGRHPGGGGEEDPGSREKQSEGQVLGRRRFTWGRRAGKKVGTVRRTGRARRPGSRYVRDGSGTQARDSREGRVGKRVAPSASQTPSLGTPINLQDPAYAGALKVDPVILTGSRWN